MKKKIYRVPDDVKPTKTALFFSHLCEKKAAKIRNKTLSEMRKNDVGNVAYYLLKCKRGVSVTLFEMLPYLVIFFSAIAYYCRLTFEIGIKFLTMWNTGLLGIVGLLCYANLSTNIVNVTRYQKTTRDCKDWLKGNLNNNTFEEIKV